MLSFVTVRRRSFYQVSACVVLVAALVGGLFGCATIAKKHRMVQARNKIVKNHVFETDLDSSWSKVREYFTNRGFNLTDQGQYKFKTDDRDSDHMNEEWEKFTVEANKVSGGWKLDVSRKYYDTALGEGGERKTENDLNTEYWLIKKIEPENAKKIDKRAKQKAEKKK